MISTNRKPLLWLVAGLLMSLLVLLVVYSGLTGRVWVTDPEGISEAANAVMTCIRTGAWKDLGVLISGNPSLELETGEENTAESLIWNAYQQSLYWVCDDEFVVQGAHVTQCITVTCLDLSAVTGTMTQILQEPAYSAADPKHKALSLRAVAEQALQSDIPTIQKEITLTFVRENGQWQVVSNDALLALLSGFTAP